MAASARSTNSSSNSNFAKRQQEFLDIKNNRFTIPADISPALLQFIQEIEANTYSIVPKQKSDAIRSLHCLRFILYFMPVIKDVIENYFQSNHYEKYARFYKYQQDYSPKGVLRDNLDTSFHVNIKAADTNKKPTEEFEEKILQYVSAIERILAKLTHHHDRGRFASLFVFQEATGCIDERVFGPIQWGVSQISTDVATLEAIMLACHSKRGDTALPIHDLALQYCRERKIDVVSHNGVVTPVTRALMLEYAADVFGEDKDAQPLDARTANYREYEMHCQHAIRICFTGDGAVEHHFSDLISAEEFVKWLKSRPYLIIERIQQLEVTQTTDQTKHSTPFIVRLTSNQQRTLKSTLTLPPRSAEQKNADEAKLDAAIKKMSPEDFFEQEIAKRNLSLIIEQLITDPIWGQNSLLGGKFNPAFRNQYPTAIKIHAWFEEALTDQLTGNFNWVAAEKRVIVALLEHNEPTNAAFYQALLNAPCYLDDDAYPRNSFRNLKRALSQMAEPAGSANSSVIIDSKEAQAKEEVLSLKKVLEKINGWNKNRLFGKNYNPSMRIKFPTAVAIYKLIEEAIASEKLGELSWQTTKVKIESLLSEHKENANRSLYQEAAKTLTETAKPHII